MNIVGVLVTTLPEYTQQVALQIPKLEAQVHHVTEQGQLVVTIEHEQDDAVRDVLTAIGSLTGVVMAAIVYHHVDENF